MTTLSQVTPFINRLTTRRCAIKFAPYEIGSGRHDADITPEILGGRQYTKKDLASYLSEACKLLVDLALPQGSTTPIAPVPAEKISLHEELAEAHRKVIDLQDQVIKLKDEIRNVETATVTKTVQRDLKSYSTMLTQNCAAALAPNRI